MGSYLQSYGAGEEQRNRTIKWLIIGFISVVLLSWFGYVFLHDYSETSTAKRFLNEVNSGNFQAAYRDWGCTESSPCPNYDFKRFMEDWGPNPKVAPPWKIDSVDGCRAFVTINVVAKGAEEQSLSVERGSKTVGYAPAPECQERKWRWKAFFQRILGQS